jgi:hypothetical protein
MRITGLLSKSGGGIFELLKIAYMKTILKSSDKHPPPLPPVDKPCAVCYNHINVNGITLCKCPWDLP